MITLDEAIEILSRPKTMKGTPQDILEAHDMAITALRQSEHLTDDDFETIRIHLSAFKESLCNQRRWKEAEDYERLLSRFMSFASSQSKIAQNISDVDLISRKAVIDVLSVGKELLSRVLDDIDVIGTDREKYSWGLGLIESYIKDIEELPSASPKQTHMVINKSKGGTTMWYQCAKCGEPSDLKDKYCRCCGRRFSNEDN